MGEGAENVIEFLRGSQTALVTFSQGRYISQVKTLAEQFPEDVQILKLPEDNHGYLLARIPVRYIKLRPPVQMSQEQRDALAERARANFRSRSMPDGDDEECGENTWDGEYAGDAADA